MDYMDKLMQRRQIIDSPAVQILMSAAVSTSVENYARQLRKDGDSRLSLFNHSVRSRKRTLTFADSLVRVFSGGHVEAVSCLEFIPAAISTAAGIHKFTYLNGLL